MANVCFGDVSDIFNAVLRLADVRCFVCKVMKECVSLQSVPSRHFNVVSPLKQRQVPWLNQR